MPMVQTRVLALALVLGSASGSFVVTNGNCFVDNDCVHSPNFPLDYENYVDCTFNPTGEGWLDVTSFEVESSSYSGYCWDHLTVHGVQYCDDYGPNGVAVNSSTTMRFQTDYSIAQGGFQICLSTVPPTPSPTIGACATSSTHFSVTEGNCTACGNCFYSPNHVQGGSYDHYHSCTISPLQSGYLDVEAFDLEDGYSWYGCR